MIIIIQRSDPQPFYSHEPVGLCIQVWDLAHGMTQEGSNVVGYLNFHHITAQQIQRTIVTIDTGGGMNDK